MHKKTCFLVLGLLSTFVYGQEIQVKNQTGNVNVWGAVYYVHKNSAERTSEVQQITDEHIFTMPPLQRHAGRYIIISRTKNALRSVILNPFGTVGIRLISVGQTDMIAAKNSIVIEDVDLPEGNLSNLDKMCAECKFKVYK